MALVSLGGGGGGGEDRGKGEAVGKERRWRRGELKLCYLYEGRRTVEEDREA